MKWQKRGLIYCPNGEYDWMVDRAMVPVCELISSDLLRIYFSVRDKQGRSTPIYLDTDPEYPEKIKYIKGDPILAFGKPGAFDDNGITSSCIISSGKKRYLYYIGWNPKVTVSYHLSIGLAISNNGQPFQKYSPGPLLDRAVDEPYFNTAPWVIFDDGIWKMWYVSCTGWNMVEGRLEPTYNIKYSISKDGIVWERTGMIAIENDQFAEAVGKPYVFKEDGLYKMIYSYRNSLNYRTDPSTSYRLGYAESTNGTKWHRSDEVIGIGLSDGGFDSIMMEYASGYIYNNKRYLVYNGNGFGESGFGYAVSQL